MSDDWSFVRERVEVQREYEEQRRRLYLRELTGLFWATLCFGGIFLVVLLALYGIVALVVGGVAGFCLLGAAILRQEIAQVARPDWTPTGRRGRSNSV